MGSLTPFTYMPGTSPVHRLDVRCKLVCLCFLCISVIRAYEPALLLASLISAGILRMSGLKTAQVFHGLRFFFVLLLLVGIARAMTGGGTPVFHWEWQGLTLEMTNEGIREGVRVSWRFGVVMLLSVSFTASTRPSRVKGAVEWFLKPVPWIPEKRVAVMISLFLKFLPMILEQAGKVSQAQKARLGELTRNPVKRLSRLAVPLLRSTLKSADRLTLAMTARSWSEDRTDPEFAPSGHERPALFLTGILCALLFLF